MAIYLDREVFHAEMTKCKRTDTLSEQAVKMFEKLAYQVTRKYYFEQEEDYRDAAQSAIYDLLKYWRGFKENPVVQLKILRNFEPGEKIIISIDGYDKIEIVACDDSVKLKKTENGFMIGETANRSLTNMLYCCKEYAKLGMYVDRVKCKITFMDNMNIEPDYNDYSSYVSIVSNCDSPITNTKPSSQNHYKFKKPPNSFSYFTSIVTNGALKFIDMKTPKDLRNGNLISMSDNKFFNLH